MDKAKRSASCCGLPLGNKMKRIGVGGSSHEGRVRRQRELYEHLEVKLRLLEEDSRSMKKAVFGYMEQRTALMSEIAHKFNDIQGGLHAGESGDSSLGITSILEPHKGSSRTGLSEVLHQDSPSPVTRDIKVNLEASRLLIRGFYESLDQ